MKPKKSKQNDWVARRVESLDNGIKIDKTIDKIERENKDRARTRNKDRDE
jgi:hypothetical protein